jgi:hypothetical protein
MIGDARTAAVLNSILLLRQSSYSAQKARSYKSAALEGDGFLLMYKRLEGGSFQCHAQKRMCENSRSSNTDGLGRTYCRAKTAIPTVTANNYKVAKALKYLHYKLLL